MKATELMIGDWVMPRIWDADSTLIKIVGIRYNSYRGKNYIDWVDYEVWEEIDVNDIEPIPLTTEILEKNGFGIDDSFRPHRFWRSADNRIILYNKDEYLNTFNKWHVHVDTENMRTIGSIELTYVHQLQQFLRLCGLDDMANNFKV